MQGIGMGREINHPLKGVAAAVGVRDGAFAVSDRRTDVTQSQFQLAQIAGAHGGVLQFSCSTASSRAARIGSSASANRPSARR